MLARLSFPLPISRRRLPGLSPAPTLPASLAATLALAVALAVALAPARAAIAATWIVGPSGTGDFQTPAEAVSQAADGDTIIVSAGTYELREPLDFNSDPLTGGAPQRPVKNLVLKSADGPEVTTLRLVTAPIKVAAASVFLFLSGEDSRSVLEGFRLVRGRAVPEEGGDKGAGGADDLLRKPADPGRIPDGIVFCRGSSPRIANCHFASNHIWVGPGLYCERSSPRVTGSRFEGLNGEAVLCIDGAPSFHSCLFSSNAGERGGGARVEGRSAPVFADCDFLGNRAEAGGALSFEGESTALLVGCRIFGNLAYGGSGGGMLLEGSGTGLIVGCRFAGNDARKGSGGGLCLSDSASVRILNSILDANLASGLGGAISCRLDSRLELVSSTIAGNYQEVGATVDCDARSFAVNSVVWRSGVSMPSPDRGPIVAYCLIDGGAPWAGEGNVSGDPKFLGLGRVNFSRRLPESDMPDFIEEAPDFRLRQGSPLIGAGLEAGTPGFDFSGRRRPCGGGVDIGAHETGLGAAEQAAPGAGAPGAGAAGPDDCEPAAAFRRGDLSGDGRWNLTDGVVLLLHLFRGGEAPACRSGADVDDGGSVDLTDAIYLLSFLFRGGPPPPEPFRECLPDLTMDGLYCEVYAACQ